MSYVAGKMSKEFYVSWNYLSKKYGILDYSAFDKDPSMIFDGTAYAKQNVNANEIRNQKEVGNGP